MEVGQSTVGDCFGILTLPTPMVCAYLPFWATGEAGCSLGVVDFEPMGLIFLRLVIELWEVASVLIVGTGGTSIAQRWTGEEKPNHALRASGCATTWRPGPGDIQE